MTTLISREYVLVSLVQLIQQCESEEEKMYYRKAYSKIEEIPVIEPEIKMKNNVECQKMVAISSKKDEKEEQRKRILEKLTPEKIEILGLR